METSNQKKTTEEVSDNFKMMNEWYNNAFSAMSDVYKKQLDQTLGFYGNIFNAISGTRKSNLNSNMNFTDLFNSDGNLKSFFMPFSWPKQVGLPVNYLTTMYENFIKQLTEYNQIQLTTVQKYFQLSQNDLSSLNDKYQQVMEQQLHAAKDMRNALNETYAKGFDFSVEANKKLISELNKQINLVMKSNEEFWTNTTKNYSPPVEEEKNYRDVKEEKNTLAVKKEVRQPA